jgi:hypothetical protein
MRIAFLLFTAVVFAAGAPSHESVSAKLIEATEYEPCDYYCGPLNHPTTAYCIEADDQTLVGEHAGFLWFGETDTGSMRNLVGKQVAIRFDQASIWMSDEGRRAIKLKRGSNYEQFQNTRRLVEVHRLKLAIAAKAQRPAQVPVDAFPLAGAQVGDYRPLYVWFSCSTGRGTGTIDCMKWYPKGDSKGTERYCTPLRGLLIPYPFSLRSNGTGFMLILRLENAPANSRWHGLAHKLTAGRETVAPGKGPT